MMVMVMAVVFMVIVTSRTPTILESERRRSGRRQHTFDPPRRRWHMVYAATLAPVLSSFVNIVSQELDTLGHGTGGFHLNHEEQVESQQSKQPFGEGGAYRNAHSMYSAGVLVVHKLHVRSKLLVAICRVDARTWRGVGTV